MSPKAPTINAESLAARISVYKRRETTSCWCVSVTKLLWKACIEKVFQKVRAVLRDIEGISFTEKQTRIL